MNTLASYAEELQGSIAQLPKESIEAAIDELYDAYRRHSKVFIFGNGGSAATAAHFACDLAKGTISPGKQRVKVICLADNVSLLTAWANDTNYGNVFAEQLDGLVDKQDAVIAISGSGNSPNVLLGVDAAKRAGATVIALSGFDGGKLAEKADINIIIPCQCIEQAEDLHLVVEHIICITLRERLRNSEVETS